MLGAMEKQLHAAQQFLQVTQLTDGSWPYYLTSSQGSPEPTCYSLLALSDGRPPTDDPALQQALNWLTAQVNADGAVTLAGDDEPHWSTAHLAITLTHLGQHATLRDRAIDWLLTWQGAPAQSDPWGAIPLNNELVGWSWISDTFSWVEPTSYGLIALKRAAIRTHPRLTEAEKLLFDRVCVGGGWNVGNPIVWDKALDAFLPTTALALLALQDVAADEIIEQGLAFLRDETNRAYSTLSLALTLLCMQAYRQPADSFVDLLLRRQLEDGSWRQMTQLTALSALALQSVMGGGNVFKI